MARRSGAVEILPILFYVPGGGLFFDFLPLHLQFIYDISNIPNSSPSYVLKDIFGDMLSFWEVLKIWELKFCTGQRKKAEREDTWERRGEEAVAIKHM